MKDTNSDIEQIQNNHKNQQPKNVILVSIHGLQINNGQIVIGNDAAIFTQNDPEFHNIINDPFIEDRYAAIISNTSLETGSLIPTNSTLIFTSLVDRTEFNNHFSDHLTAGYNFITAGYNLARTLEGGFHLTFSSTSIDPYYRPHPTDVVPYNTPIFNLSNDILTVFGQCAYLTQHINTDRPYETTVAVYVNATEMALQQQGDNLSEIDFESSNIDPNTSAIISSSNSFATELNFGPDNNTNTTTIIDILEMDLNDQSNASPKENTLDNISFRDNLSNIHFEEEDNNDPLVNQNGNESDSSDWDSVNENNEAEKSYEEVSDNESDSSDWDFVNENNEAEKSYEEVEEVNDNTKKDTDFSTRENINTSSLPAAIHNEPNGHNTAAAYYDEYNGHNTAAAENENTSPIPTNPNNERWQNSDALARQQNDESEMSYATDINNNSSEEDSESKTNSDNNQDSFLNNDDYYYANIPTQANDYYYYANIPTQANDVNLFIAILIDSVFNFGQTSFDFL